MLQIGIWTFLRAWFQKKEVAGLVPKKEVADLVPKKEVEVGFKKEAHLKRVPEDSVSPAQPGIRRVVTIQDDLLPRVLLAESSILVEQTLQPNPLQTISMSIHTQTSIRT